MKRCNTEDEVEGGRVKDPFILLESVINDDDFLNQNFPFFTL